VVFLGRKPRKGVSLRSTPIAKLLNALLRIRNKTILSESQTTNLRGPQNPNFLLGFGDPTNFMRLSLMKAAHGVLGGAAYRKFGSFAFLAKLGYATVGSRFVAAFHALAGRRSRWNPLKRTVSVLES
jgi:hypothetical protein